MNTRTTGETVTFRHSFRLSGVDDVQPAGCYRVETDEELLQGLSVPAYRRISTFIRLPGRHGSAELARVVDIHPAELVAALASDAQVPAAAPAAERTAAATPQARRGAAAFVVKGWKQWLALNATELQWTALVAAGVALAGLFAGSIGGASGSP